MILECPRCKSSEVFMIAGAKKFCCKNCHLDFGVEELKKSDFHA